MQVAVGPQDQKARIERLADRAAVQIAAQRLHLRSGGGVGPEALRRACNGQGSQGRAPIGRIGGFEGFETELKPGEAAPVAAPLQLLRPHVGERLTRVRSQVTAFTVPRGQDQGVEHGLGPPRLAGFRQADRLVGIEGLDLVPQPHPLHDIVEHRHLSSAGSGFAQLRAEPGARQHLRQSRMAGHADGAVIALRPGPLTPPCQPTVEISGRAAGVPRRLGRRHGGRLGDQNRRQKADARSNQPAHRLFPRATHAIGTGPHLQGGDARALGKLGAQDLTNV